MASTPEWYQASPAQPVALTAQETSQLVVFELDKENKFKPHILNNAFCFKYSVHGKASLQQEAFSYCLSRNQTPN